MIHLFIDGVIDNMNSYVLGNQEYIYGQVVIENYAKTRNCK